MRAPWAVYCFESWASWGKLRHRPIGKKHLEEFTYYIIGAYILEKGLDHEMPIGHGSA
jgi:hypothetical protein